jgi:phosphotransferase system  glucose/maltose/N-acetylglucosamine-specific IIC component
MIVESTAISLKQPIAYRPILWGGLIAGTLDITAAVVNSGLRGVSPMRVLQSVASGLLGPNSYKSGYRAAALGLVIHLFIAFVACLVFYTLSRKLEFLVRRAVVCGVLYGVAVYLVMYGIVLRVTFHRSFFYPLSAVIIAVLIHMFCVGLPISLVVRRYSK